MSTNPATGRTTARPPADATVDRAAAVALVVGTLAGFTTMALHPTGRDAVRDASAGALGVRLPAVHALGIVAQPLLLAGTLALTRRLRGGRAAAAALAVGAAAYFALASVAILVAAAASGFVAPGVLRGLADADAPARAARLAALRYTGELNQAFARIDVLLTGAAVLLWSSAMLLVNRDAAGRPWPRALPAYGLLLGVAMALGAATGHLRLNVHGFGLVVLGQGVWVAGVAAHLWRAPQE